MMKQAAFKNADNTVQLKLLYDDTTMVNITIRERGGNANALKTSLSYDTNLSDFTTKTQDALVKGVGPQLAAIREASDKLKESTIELNRAYFAANWLNGKIIASLNLAMLSTKNVEDKLTEIKGENDKISKQQIDLKAKKTNYENRITNHSENIVKKGQVDICFAELKNNIIKYLNKLSEYEYVKKKFS